MWFSQHQSAKTLALLVVLSTAAPISVSAVLHPVFAQDEATPFPVPTEVARGTVVRITGSSSTAGIHEALAQRFKAQYAGTDVEITYGGSEDAVQSVINGDIDLASIGRSLTEQELNQGLVEVPIARKKIAIIVGQENPFRNSITTEQFAQIFRGEITDWSELGGTPGPIRFIDRPATSDTRQAFQSYPVFEGAPFETGTNAEPVSEDSVEAVIQALGADGIGYAVVDQVTDNPDVAIVPMHNVLPTDPRYPFSQPLAYVYKAPETSEPARIFLGFISASDSQQVIADASTGAVSVPVAQATATPEPPASLDATATETATPNATTAPEPTTSATDPNATTHTNGGADGSFPWWLLLIPLVGGLLWWLLKGRGGTTPAAVPAALPAESEESRLILTPRTCRDAYAYWEVPDRAFERMRQEGGQALMLRIHDVTDIDLQNQEPHSTQEFTCNPTENDLHVPIATDDRDYVAELGYITREQRWLSIARSPHVRVPACTSAQASPALPVAAAAAAGAVATGLAAKTLGYGSEAAAIAPDAALVVDDSRMILVPRSPQDVYAYWELSDAHQMSIREQGGYPLTLRLYDATDSGADPSSLPVLQAYECPEGDVDLHIPIQQSDRDYAAELGYVGRSGERIKVAQAAPIHVPAQTADGVPVSIPQGLASAVVATGAATGLNLVRSPEGDRTAQSTPSPPVGRVEPSGDCQIILVPRNASDVYVYWEVTPNFKQPLQQQGGQTLMLRVHDATNLDIDAEVPHSTQEYAVSELDQDKHVKISVSDRDYIAELGYYTADQRWLRIIRSFHTHVPASAPVS